MFSCCQRARASCSILVGRPRGLLGGGGCAGRLDSIHCKTSCSYQQSRLLCGNLNGLGIKWAYLRLVAHVRIVFVVFPSNADSCSTKSILGSWPSAATRDASNIYHSSLVVSGVAAERHALCARHLGSVKVRPRRRRVGARLEIDQIVRRRRREMPLTLQDNS